MSQSETVICPR